MAINPHDDYEALAKLLYPSIEASGNVYYGQTRKLTMDEILGKNDLGFESHIESVKVADSSADYGFSYVKKYCWKLGPFHGVIDYKTDDEFLVRYEKYKINIDSSVNINVLHSGDYKTYEKNVTLSDAGYYSSNGSAPNNSSEYWDGRNFYVTEENNCHYLFIAIPQDMTHNDDYLELKAVGGPVDITLNKTGDFDWYVVECWGGRTYRYLYKKNTDSDYSDYEGNTITLQNGESVFFKAASNRPAFSQQSYVSFSMTSASSTASVEAFGNLSAMSRGNDNEEWDYEFYKLFESCTLLTRAPYIPKPPSNCEHTFHDIFHNCTSLKRVQPTLPMPDYPDHGCYQSAFKGCTSLEVAPYLPSDDGYNGCYSEMFYGCRLLKEVKARIRVNNAHDDYTRNWLKDAGIDATDKKLIYLSKESADSQFLIGDDSFVPSGWEIRDLSGERATCMAIVKTSGNDVYLSDIDPIAVSDTGISFRTFYDSEFEVSGEYVICLMSDPIDGANANGISIGHIHFNNNPEYPRVTSITNTTVTDGAIDKPVINTLITNGCDSSENGRGSITMKSTIGNMAKENPFLKGGRYGYDSGYGAPIKPDTYNSDGSYNQEIWGYKCFNSPVSFRNGIYGENASLIAFSDDNFSGSTLYQKDSGLSQCSNNDDVLSQLMTYKKSDASDFSFIGDLTITNGHSDGTQMITSIHNDDSDVEYNFDSFVKSSIASGVDGVNDAWTESDTSIGSTMHISADNLTFDRGAVIDTSTWFGFSGTLIKSSLTQTDPNTEFTNINNVAGVLITDESVKLTASKYEQVHPDDDDDDDWDDDDDDFGDDDDDSNESEPVPESENPINGKYTSRSEVEIYPDHVTIGFDDVRDSNSYIALDAPNIYLNSAVNDNTKIELNARDTRLIGNYGLASFIDSDTVKRVNIMSCDGGGSADLSCRDRVSGIYSDAKYTDSDTYAKSSITVKSNISESVSRVVPYHGRFEKSSIDLGICTTSSDNPNVSIQLSSENNPELYDDYGSNFDRTNKISMFVKSDSEDKLSKIDLNSSSIYLNADYIYINKNGSWPAAEFQGNTSVTFNTKVHVSKNLFGDIDVGDHGSLKAFYVQRYNGFSMSVIAITLVSVGNYYICPGDVITYDRRAYGNRTITFTKYNATITVGGATRITNADNIDDVYLAIMTPSGYKNSEFRAMANVVFTILSFARTADSGGAVIYALASMEEGSF